MACFERKNPSEKQQNQTKKVTKEKTEKKQDQSGNVTIQKPQQKEKNTKTQIESIQKTDNTLGKRKAEETNEPAKKKRKKKKKKSKNAAKLQE